MYSSYNRGGRRSEHSEPAEPRNADREAPQKPQPEEEPKPDVKRGLLDTLLEDKEQSLLMLLILILMKDGADLDLILALMYLVI